MSTILQFNGLAKTVLPRGPLHLAIGMFDGLHRGHQAVIRLAVEDAAKDRGVAGVLTFWPHPSAILRPGAEPVRMLMQPADKVRMLADLGVDAVITEPFTAEFAAVEAASFLARLKARLPALRAVYVGENWRFGRGRLGDVNLLQAEGRQLGIRVHSVARVRLGDEPISSTRIRSLLESGEIESANAMLGYPYFARGVVVAGQKLGRKIGFPTLNLDWHPAQPPRLGVYAVKVRRDDDVDPVAAVANYGVRPTVDDQGVPVLEVHVLDECAFAPGDNLHVAFHHFLRAEQRFTGLDALKSQIAADREKARDWFAEQA